MDAKAIWDALTKPQQEILWAIQQDTLRGVVHFYFKPHVDELAVWELIENSMTREQGITPLGVAVLAAGKPQADAGAAFDPYDYSVMTAAELLDVAREAWQKYDLKEVVDEYADMGASVMMDLAMNATPATDELATLRAQLAEAQAERDAAREALREIADGAPTEKPVGNTAYPVVSLNARESNIAYNHYDDGHTVGRWFAAQIARAALRAADAGSEGG